MFDQPTANTDFPQIYTLKTGHLSLEQAQILVGGYVEIIHLHDGTQMLVNEDGLFRNMPVNVEASALYGSLIVGNVVLLKGSARWK